MSRRGNCRDNVSLKGFFRTLKVKRAYYRVYPTRDAAQRDLFGSIEGFHNTSRLHSELG